MLWNQVFTVCSNYNMDFVIDDIVQSAGSYLVG